MTTPFRVLLLADELGADLLIHELRRGYDAVRHAWIDTEEALRRALADSAWDVVIYEQGELPFDALSALACLERAGQLLPFVIVTGSNSPEVAATALALKAGVRGYVSKSQLSRLVPIVRQVCREAGVDNQRLLTEQKVHLFEETVDAISQGVLIADAAAPGYKISYVNRAFERMTGFTAGELLGRDLRVLTEADVDALPFAEVYAALREGRPTQVDWRRVRKDGTPCWLGLTIKPLWGEGKGLKHFMVVLTDESCRRRLEEQLRLAQKVETNGRLAGDIVHDFDNLLTAILGYSEILLRETPADSRSHDNLLQIIRAGERAGRLARGLLAFSDNRVCEPHVQAVNSVIEETLLLLRDLIGEDVELTLALDPVSAVRADRVQLEQVLMILIINAREAMPRGGRLIVHTAEVFLQGTPARQAAGVAAGWYVQLSVSDTGCGTTEEPGPGSGLGLTLVRDIVGQLGGFIEVETRPGVGSTFRLLFPRAAQLTTVPDTAPVFHE